MLNKALIRPFKMFAHEPIVQLLGLYMAFAYGLLYCMCADRINHTSSYTFQCMSRQCLRFSRVCIMTEQELPAFTTSPSALVSWADHK